MKVDSESAVCTAASVENEGIELEPLRIRDWAACDRQALHEYKDEYLETYSRSIHRLPEAAQTKAMMEAIDRMASVTLSDLPKQKLTVYERDYAGRVVFDDDGRPKEVDREVPYERWWLTTIAGNLHVVYLSMKRTTPATTKDAVDALFQEDRSKLKRTANKVAEISEPKLGN